MSIISMNVSDRIESEFALAEHARLRGNDGRARVCARRAAGIAVRTYFERQGIPASSLSTIDLLNQLETYPGLDPSLKPIIRHLAQRVNEKFELPAGVDLISEARQLCDRLLG